MVYVLARTNRSFTHEFFPLFEVIYGFELRLSLCNLVVQGLLGISARLIFIHSLYTGDSPLEERPLVVIASLLRVSLFEVFVSVFFFFAVERIIATFAWSWYEKGTPRTLLVFVVLESCAMAWSWFWAVGIVFEFIAPTQLIVGVLCSIIIGFAAVFFVIAINYRVSIILKAGARINRYSVAKSYQIRENIVIIKALVKIATRVMLLNIPVIIIAVILVLENALERRAIIRAFFDLAISFYPPAIISFIPFSDVIFERSLKRTVIGNRLFNAFSIFHFSPRTQKQERLFPLYIPILVQFFMFRMTYIMIRFNRTHTDEFYPIFEIFYAFELRLSLCNLVVQGLLGISARLICIYNLYVGNGPLENRTAIIVASFLRVSLFETFVSVIFFFALERLIATFAWSWYEKASLPTLTVFVAIEGCAVSWAWTWSIALLNEFIAVKKLLIGVICSLIIGCATLAVVIVVNLRASAQLKVGARINQYSVARSYQIHENIIIMKALVRIAIRVLMLNIPVIILSIISNFVSGEHALVKRMITRACFDLVISFYPPAIISYIPFSDAIFERSLKRTALGRRLFSVFAFFHFYQSKQKQKRIVVNETDHYFGMLDASLRVPPLNQ